MANAKVDTGHGATITLSTSALAFNWTGMDLGEESIPDVDRSHLATADYREYMPGDLKEPGLITIPFQWDSDAAQVAEGVPETITVTFPLASGGSTAATFAGTGYINKVTRPNLQTDTIQNGEITIKLDGLTGPVYTAAT